MMYEKLKKEVNDFLIDYSITGMAGFNDWVFQQIGLIRKNNDNGFDSRYGSKELYFNASGLDLNELALLLQFFNIDPSSYKTNNSLKINPTQVFDVLLPQFKGYVESIANSPKLLRPYQIDSKKALESMAVQNIKKYSDDLLKKILKDEKTDALTLEKKQLCKILLQAKGATELLYQSNSYSEFVFEAQQELKKLTENFPLLEEEPTLKLSLKELQSAFAAYARFNRVEIVRAVKQLFHDLQDFVKEFAITLGSCDIFEETLLRMAGITQMPSKSSFETSTSDRTRVNFWLTGLTKEEALPLIDFFLSHGDDSAVIKAASGSRSYASSLECFSVEQSAAMFIEQEPKIEIPKQIVNVDGEVLVNKIFPLFVAKIRELALESPETLVPYQQKSASFFEDRPRQAQVIQSVGPSTLFYHPVEQSSPVLELGAESIKASSFIY